MNHGSDELTELFARLTPRERDLLKLRYGLEDGVQRTRAEIAELYGWSENQVRQREFVALRKLGDRWTPPE